MIPKELIDRINELSKKAKSVGLSEEEREEQKAKRALYTELFKKQFEQQLLNVKIVDQAGNDVTPEKLKQAKLKKNSDCQ